MASARNEAPKGVWCGEWVSPSHRGEVLVVGCVMVSPENLYIFFSSNGKFWCILEANCIAVKLPVLHA